MISWVMDIHVVDGYRRVYSEVFSINIRKYLTHSEKHLITSFNMLSDLHLLG